jgi:hypothetical protein
MPLLKDLFRVSLNLKIFACKKKAQHYITLFHHTLIQPMQFNTLD